MAARATAATTYCHALRGALQAKLRAAGSQLRSCCGRGVLGAYNSRALLAALAALACGGAAFPRAVAFFLPLVASTSACCAVAYLSAASERGSSDAGGEVVAAEAVLLVDGHGGKPEAGLLQVFGDANASAYGGGPGGGVQVGCFLRRSVRLGVDEDGEEVVFAGRLATCGGGGAQPHGAVVGAALEEQVSALRVDRLAEGVWNSYFGGWSRWHDVDVDAAFSCS